MKKPIVKRIRRTNRPASLQTSRSSASTTVPLTLWALSKNNVPTLYRSPAAIKRALREGRSIDTPSFRKRGSIRRCLFARSSEALNRALTIEMSLRDLCKKLYAVIDLSDANKPVARIYTPSHHSLRPAGKLTLSTVEMPWKSNIELYKEKKFWGEVTLCPETKRYAFTREKNFLAKPMDESCGTLLLTVTLDRLVYEYAYSNERIARAFMDFTE